MNGSLPRWWSAVAEEMRRWAEGAGWTAEQADGIGSLTLALLLAQQDGHAALPLGAAEKLRPWWRRLEEMGLSKEAIAAGGRLAAALAERPEAFAQLVALGGPPDPQAPPRPLRLARTPDGAALLQSDRVARLEARIGGALAARLRTPSALGSAARDAEALLAPLNAIGPGQRLAAGQRRAIVQALRRPLAVVSGGPGTGKTTVVAALLRAWLRARTGVDPEPAALAEAVTRIALTAPTGKAADRMREAIARQLRHATEAPEAAALLERLQPASTVHRLLGYSPAADRFRHGPHRPLPFELVVLDEASMLDLELAAALLEALEPSTHLVVLGDAEQLPAVGLGAVLRDVTAAAEQPDAPEALQACLVRLTENYRMRTGGAGARVLAAAEAVRRGEPQALRSALAERTATTELRGEGAEWLAAPDATSRTALLQHWYARHVAARCLPAGTDTPPWRSEPEAARRYLQALGEQRILAAVRAGPGSVQEANAVCSALHARRLGRLRGAGAGDLFEGVPALVVRNDYALGLYNGDLGVVLLSEGGSRARYEFVLERAGALRSWPLSQVRRLLEPAWAMTVHKAQGSEFERVAVLLPEQFGRPLGRELLYTALSRARRGAVLVGDWSVVERTLACRERRLGGLPLALGEALARAGEREGTPPG